MFQTDPRAMVQRRPTVTSRRSPRRPRGQADGPRRVVMVAFPEVQILDVTGPLEVFSMATKALCEGPGRDPGYRITLAARESGPVVASSGLRLLPDARLASLRGPIDTLLVAGGEGTPAAVADQELVAWVTQAERRARRVCAVCSGAFVLARAGLLDGRRATTHWASAHDLARRFPSIHVETDRIFVRDDHVWTSAGVTAGMDLALALVEEDCGREIALAVARRLVLFLKRPGGQSQFSTQLANQLSDRSPLRELQGWIAGHPEADLSVDALAHRVAMSPRHFARVFTRELAVTPARYVESVRVEVARRRLEESSQGVEGIAAECGFGSVETLRRAFVRNLGIGPKEYRNRFRPLGPEPQVEGARR